MDLEFEKYCKVDQSPRTVLPSPQHHAKYEKSSKKKPKSSSKHNQLKLEAGFNEIKLRNYHRSVSCKTLPTRNIELAVDTDVLKRGSIYQCSKERTTFKKPEGRKKIEFSVSDDASFSFSFLDSICGSDEEESSLKLDYRGSSTSKLAERDLISNSKFESNEVVGPLSSANILKEDENLALQKSLSARLALPHSPTNSDSELDNGVVRSSGLRNKNLRKSLLREFSCTMSHTECCPPCSPAHLHGDLKFVHKHGMPYFELSLPHSDSVLVAKIRKEQNAVNWAYTFHSFQGRKSYINKESLVVGQMQVSSQLCFDLKEGGELTNSMLTEFVLYDVMNARKSLATEELSSGLTNAFDSYLHPSHEIAAIVVQVPFEKRESLKHRSGDKYGSQVQPNLLNLSLPEQTPKGDTTIVNVVTPLGNHGLPTSESKGPLSLLERWRLGGGCDCGGWDMACPLIVFDNLSTEYKREQNSLLQSNQPFYLYFQGSKEKTPALTIKLARKGHYSVDFHAQLSALQAFAICVAILHASEASCSVDNEKHKQLSQCSSKETDIDDEVKVFIEAVSEEKKNKERETSFVLNPPFSPIARV